MVTTEAITIQGQQVAVVVLVVDVDVGVAAASQISRSEG